VWVALRASVRSVLEQVTLADVARGELPPHVVELTQEPDAWSRR
jgi:DNA-binding IscR family transcriptional regulator